MSYVLENEKNIKSIDSDLIGEGRDFQERATQGSQVSPPHSDAVATVQEVNCDVLFPLAQGEAAVPASLETHRHRAALSDCPGFVLDWRLGSHDTQQVLAVVILKLERCIKKCSVFNSVTSISSLTENSDRDSKYSIGTIP